MNHYLKSLIIIFLAISCIYCEEEVVPVEDTPKELSPAQTYFLEIALNSGEFGSGRNEIKKWASDLRIYIPDTAATVLMAEFEKVKDEINTLSKSIQLRRVATEQEANFIMFFGSGEDYAAIEPSAEQGIADNWGMFFFWWNAQCNIYRGSMYVDIIRTRDFDCQKHLLREELTQALGLERDSFQYSESIFYENWNCTTEYTEIDKEVISLFLDPRIRSGMTEEEVRVVFSTL